MVDETPRRRRTPQGAIGRITPGHEPEAVEARYHPGDELPQRADDLPPVLIDPRRLTDERTRRAPATPAHDPWAAPPSEVAPDDPWASRPDTPAAPERVSVHAAVRPHASSPAPPPAKAPPVAEDPAWDAPRAPLPVAHSPEQPGDWDEPFDWSEDNSWAAAPAPRPPSTDGDPMRADSVNDAGRRVAAERREALDALDEAESGPDLPPMPDAPPGPTQIATTRRAQLAAPSAVSLISSRMDTGEDPLSDPFSAFATLEPGQTGFLRLSFRASPEFRAEAAEWSTAIRGGEAPGPKMGKGRTVMAAIGWFIRSVIHHSSQSAQGPGPKSPFSKAPPAPIPTGQLSDETKEALREAEVKARDVAHYEVRMWTGAIGPPEDRAGLEHSADAIALGFAGLTSVHQRLEWAPDGEWDGLVGYMPSGPDTTTVFSAGELSRLAHPPDDTTRAHGVRIARAGIKPLPLANPIVVPDRLNPPKGLIPLGLQNPGSEDEVVVGLNNAQLDQHAVIFGRTGTGKSVLLQWLVFGIAKADYPIVLVDPHGALVDDVAANLIRHCPERIDDMVIVDFADLDWPVALNPLDVHDRSQVEGTVGAVREMFANFAFDGASAPRAMTYLEQALTVLAEVNTHLKDPATKTTLLQVSTFFSDPEFRRYAVELCSNPSIREAYNPESGPFEQLSERQQVEHTQPIRRVIDRLGNSDSFGNVFSSCTNRLDFPSLIKGNKIVLLKMARFAQQRELGSLIARLLIPWMLGSMGEWGRQRDPYSGQTTGRGCRVIVDEAPTLFGPESAAIQVLAEARKYDFGLIAAAQFPTQFPRDVEQALYANTASKLSLALDPGAVGGIARSLAGSSGLINPDDIVSLPNYHGYGNILMSNPGGGGVYTSGPFALKFLPPLSEGVAMSPDERAQLDRVLARSHQLVSNPRPEIEAKRQTLLDDLKSAMNRAAHRSTDEARTPAPTTHLDLDQDDEVDEGGWGWAVDSTDE